MVREELFNDMRKAIVEGDKPRAQELAREAISSGADLNEVIDKGTVPAIQVVGQLFENGEYFLPELISSAECMKAAMDILQPELAKAKIKSRSLGKVVVFDLGTDVKLERFIEKAEAEKADIICLSALLTTTMINQKRFIEMLRQKNLYGKYKVLVGGAPATRKWADEIGAQGFAENAPLAVKMAKAAMAK
jgi:methanogenic corrinoid protein MtbC1